MKGLSHPLVIVALGLLLGLGAGLGTFWPAALALARAERENRIARQAPVRPEKPWDFWTLEIENLAAELKDRKAAQIVREQAIAAREERLTAEQAELEKTRLQIDAIRTELLGKMIELEADETKNLKTLAKTYSEMSPRAAVGILRELDETTTVKILFLMKSDVVGLILQEMGASSDPEVVKQAAHITDRLRLVKTPKPTS